MANHAIDPLSKSSVPLHRLAMPGGVVFRGLDVRWRGLDAWTIPSKPQVPMWSNARGITGRVAEKRVKLPIFETKETDVLDLAHAGRPGPGPWVKGLSRWPRKGQAARRILSKGMMAHRQREDLRFPGTKGLAKHGDDDQAAHVEPKSRGDHLSFVWLAVTIDQAEPRDLNQGATLATPLRKCSRRRVVGERSALATAAAANVNSHRADGAEAMERAVGSRSQRPSRCRVVSPTPNGLPFNLYEARLPMVETSLPHQGNGAYRGSIAKDALSSPCIAKARCELQRTLNDPWPGGARSIPMFLAEGKIEQDLNKNRGNFELGHDSPLTDVSMRIVLQDGVPRQDEAKVCDGTGWMDRPRGPRDGSIASRPYSRPRSRQGNTDPRFSQEPNLQPRIATGNFEPGCLHRAGWVNANFKPHAGDIEK